MLPFLFETTTLYFGYVWQNESWKNNLLDYKCS